MNSLWNKVFSRNLVDWNVDYTSYTYITNGTDMFQMLPVVFNAKRILYFSDVLYHYTTDSENSIVHKFNRNVYVSLRENYLRLEELIETNNNKIKNMDRILRKRFLYIASTSAYKIRLCSDEKIKNEYILEIARDKLFRKNYYFFSLKDIGIARWIIVTLLYLKWNKLLLFLIKYVN